MSKKQLYVDIWKKYLPNILSIIKSGNGSTNLDGNEFESVGNRKDYSFRLDIKNGEVPEKEGNAVARDLKIVLDESEGFYSLAKDKNLTIRMDKKFVIHVM